MYFTCLQIKRLTGCSVLALATVLLSGCFYITNSRVIGEPEDTNNRARIRIISNALVRGFPNSRCVNFAGSKSGVIYDKWSNSGSQGFRNRKIDMLPGKFYEATPKDLFGKSVLGFEKAEFYAAANQPIILNMRYTGTSYVCTLPIAFIPEKNQDYEVVFDVGAKNCFSRIISLTDPDKKIPIAKVERCEPEAD